MTRVRVLLVDDSEVFLNSAAAHLACDPRVLIVGHAHDGREGLQLAIDTAPDLVLMDLAMPVMDGLVATRRLKGWPVPPHVVIVTMHDDPEYRRRAREAGADAFVCKAQFTEALSSLIDSLFPVATRA